MRRLGTAVTVFVTLAAALTSTRSQAAPDSAFPWDAQTQPEWVGSVQDVKANEQQMAGLQKMLANQQVDRALGREIAVKLTAAERSRIDSPGATTGKYLVGTNKAVGIEVTLDSRTRDLQAGSVKGLPDGGFVWTSVFRVPGATALRAHLTGVDLPRGATLYVYNLAGQAFGPYRSRGPNGNGDVFTNTVFGDRLLLQVKAAPGTGKVAPFRIEELGVLGQRFTAPRYNPSGAFSADDLSAIALASNLCSRNAACVVNAGCTSSSAVSAAKQAVAGMLFSSGGGQYICTGGLIADTVTTSVIPYFLTAHHCIGSSGEASSLETYFDYTTTCSSPNCTQPYNNTGDTVGATILATSTSSDYSFLRLASAPVTKDGTAAYLGWSSTAIANTNGVQLYRISHPSGSPQAYSEQRIDTGKGTCRTLPRGSFLYSTDNLGATEGGSSGSPVVNGSGQIVGQLYGACGTNLNDVCDSASNATVDGAFAATYPNVASWLSPGGGSCSPVGAVCTTSAQCCSNSCKGKPGAKTCK